MQVQLRMLSVVVKLDTPWSSCLFVGRGVFCFFVSYVTKLCIMRVSLSAFISIEFKNSCVVSVCTCINAFPYIRLCARSFADSLIQSRCLVGQLAQMSLVVTMVTASPPSSSCQSFDDFLIN